jgi:hypothetical protein
MTICCRSVSPKNVIERQTHANENVDEVQLERHLTRREIVDEEEGVNIPIRGRGRWAWRRPRPF